ncbi:threonine synthase [Helicobacter labacensis]|uniref:threonine synthase n=1 Tax=Helicobacter labacensis TaxID=2316079 RepID=UPI000EADCEBB|nr:threonine synthase [Helicobacter labacensis]
MVLLLDSRSGTAIGGFERALLDPSCQGLCVPQNLPQVDFSTYLPLSYAQATQTLFKALELNLNPALLDRALERYSKFEAIAPLHALSPSLYVQELFHGPTLAFKDMALQPFGVLLSELAKARQEKYLIMVATSGDTGPATLASFANLPNTYVFCLYPAQGTSLIQALQMQTIDAPNLKVVGLEGNFDDAQSALKTLLHDEDFQTHLAQKDLHLSVANSINFGRIIFQMVYHIWGYLDLVRAGAIQYGDPIKIMIPSGNFGNALGAFYAKAMGLPVEKISVVSNANDVLTEFFNTGVYDLRTRSLLKTPSPAMDILKSSNIERLLFALFGSERTQECMQALQDQKYYALTSSELQSLRAHFEAFSCDDTHCLDTIARTYCDQHYLIDPHTATALYAYEHLESRLPCVVVSTASWSKFAHTTALALGKQAKDDQEALQVLAKEGIMPPARVQELLSKPLIHKDRVGVSDLQNYIKTWLENF